MRTQTRSRIVAIIARKGDRRPVELVGDLQLTPQAIHRHLKTLVAAGALEILGRGPLTRYVIAGAPRLAKPQAWYRAKSEPTGNPGEFACETRDVFAARQSRLTALAKTDLDKDELSLVISVAGEVGNNCFDHNLGRWRDVPGCWFETQATGGRLWMCIADRGQGVFRSLSHGRPEITDEPTALSAAFERNISGRAPENRGNGLKFVKNIIVQGQKRGLACRSGGALVEYGALGPRCAQELSRWSPNAGGTATLILWSLK